MNRFPLPLWLLVSLSGAGCASAPIRVDPIKPPPQTYTVTVRVFEGDPAQDHKAAGATVTIAGRTVTTDGAGNVGVNEVTAGSYEACAVQPLWKRACSTGAVPGQSIDISLERDVPPMLPVRVDGRFWITDAGTFRPIFQSGLTLLVRGPPERAAFLDQTRELGFDGVRVFAGDLGWAPQTPAQARDTLPTLLDEAAVRGLYVYVSALQGGGYDVEAHLRAIAQICAAHPNCLLEVANEIGHPSQSDIAKDPPRLLELARRVIPTGVIWTLGSAGDEAEPDGSYGGAGGPFVDGHLDRGRDLYNQVRRLREIAGLSETFRVPAMSGEPIGISEVPMPGKQRLWGDDAPRFSFAMGVLCRGFELGCVFHSEPGLHAELLGPNTAAAAREFIAGWKAIDTDQRLTFVNAGWAGSPVRGANFDTGIVRAYSFIAGSRGWTVLVGVRGDPAIEWGGGWRQVGVVADRLGIQIIEIEK